jgi:SPP1 gp7 family putative phage head morphogenesis protein
VRYQNWETNKILEEKYRRSLRRIARLLIDSVAGLNDSEEINRALNSLYRSRRYHNLSETIARRFVTMGNTIDAKTWREAAKGGSINPEYLDLLNNNLIGNLGMAIEQKTLENAQYIKTLPLNVAEQITAFVKTQTYKSIRASEISKQLQTKVANYSKARADLIARTESSKAMTALTEARARDVGVKWYQWRTADDGKRVRNSHRHMEGVLVRWDDPPSPEALIGEKDVGKYNAGNIFNCRCYPSPLVTLNRVKWPAKVYYQGGIQTMTREQFEKIA